MYKNTYITKLRLLTLFCALEERDKDIVISMAESLVKRCKNNLAKNITDFSTYKMKEDFYEKQD